MHCRSVFSTLQHILEFAVSNCDAIAGITLSWTGPSAPGGAAFVSSDPHGAGTLSNSATFIGTEEYTALLEVRDAEDNVLSNCSASAGAVAAGG